MANVERVQVNQRRGYLSDDLAGIFLCENYPFLLIVGDLLTKLTSFAEFLDDKDEIVGLKDLEYLDDVGVVEVHQNLELSVEFFDFAFNFDFVDNFDGPVLFRLQVSALVHATEPSDTDLLAHGVRVEEVAW